jgi:hypothetical protein
MGRGETTATDRTATRSRRLPCALSAEVVDAGTCRCSLARRSIRSIILAVFLIDLAWAAVWAHLGPATRSPTAALTMCQLLVVAAIVQRVRCWRRSCPCNPPQLDDVDIWVTFLIDLTGITCHPPGPLLWCKPGAAAVVCQR